MIYGIVLAAGLGRRLGGPKALVSLGGLTFHRRAVGAFRQADHEVVVVINAQVREALPEPEPGERRVINPNPDQAAGMFASVRLGLAAVQGKGAKGVVLLPVDHPLVTGEDIRAVADALRNGAAIAVATHGGRRGHPIGLSAAVMEEITADPLLQTLREVVRRDRSRVREVAVSEGALDGVNTEEDLERVSRRSFR